MHISPVMFVQVTRKAPNRRRIVETIKVGGLRVAPEIAYLSRHKPGGALGNPECEQRHQQRQHVTTDKQHKDGHRAPKKPDGPVYAPPQKAQRSYCNLGEVEQPGLTGFRRGSHECHAGYQNHRERDVHAIVAGNFLKHDLASTLAATRPVKPGFKHRCDVGRIPPCAVNRIEFDDARAAFGQSDVHDHAGSGQEPVCDRLRVAPDFRRCTTLAMALAAPPLARDCLHGAGPACGVCAERALSADCAPGCFVEDPGIECLVLGIRPDMQPPAAGKLSGNVLDCNDSPVAVQQLVTHRASVPAACAE
ncbi:conserved hypothetical protein [Ricinus communis]|uniref:Uncharacterized protein n=1 Tax=Ricinus communis TaxID=3988 RepID=B9TIM9_RICCO|nr:conserved hypothetical protein [Ricinus communis]